MGGRTSEGDLATVTTLRASVMRLARRLRHQRVEHTLSSTEMQVLATLSRTGPATPGELARQEHVQPPSMTRIIALLEDKGLVRREPHPQDRRQVLVIATEPAAEILEQSRRLRDAWLADLVGKLTDEEWELVRSAAPVLERLAQL
ncbi:MarR family winged helix-turn-helix transcriptional regulator [Nocardia jiangxiensis]|uniref:MarR family winged helix-turn-helix transcriptional regulator n=1 Tax=Nocardia jiangxiensis TaxID=282685 RepID=A0ABW6S5Y5_9NOCA|nr:MarR family transcriptional regulator [Nocardia jiangxiensis]